MHAPSMAPVARRAHPRGRRGGPGQAGAAGSLGRVVVAGKVASRVALGAVLLVATAGCGASDERDRSARGAVGSTSTSAPADEPELGTSPPAGVGEPDAPTTAAPVPPPSVPPAAPSPPPRAPDPTTTPPSRSFVGVPEGARVDIVASGLAAPWDVAFAPDGRAFVGERDSGQVSVIEPTGELRALLRLPVASDGEAGLLGLAVSPDFARDGWLYAYTTTASDNRIIRVRPDDGVTEVVLAGIPRAAIHDGGRIGFGPDGLLYAGTGDAGVAAAAADPGSLAGKILRVAPDGSVPADNPFGNPVWATGLRNVQGLAWDDGGRLWSTTFGPDRDDELNLIRRGADHGWPEVTGSSGGRFADPALVLQPDEASPTGMAFVRGDSAWAGSLLFGALRGQRVWRATPTPDGGVTDVEPLLIGTFGRVRHVTQAPDGSLWLLTSNRDGRGSPRAGDDLIVRITPPPR